MIFGKKKQKHNTGTREIVLFTCLRHDHTGLGRTLELKKTKIT